MHDGFVVVVPRCSRLWHSHSLLPHGKMTP
jgi:hypothetical protein